MHLKKNALKEFLVKLTSFFWILYFLIGLVFLFFAGWILILSVGAAIGYHLNLNQIHHLVKVVDGLIVALVLVDISEYFLKEKLSNGKALGPEGKRLSSVLTIIIIALILDALLNTLLIDETKEYKYLIYPAVSFFAAILLITSLVIYQKFSSIDSINEEKNNNSQE